jgi:hypothetical protein
MTSGSSTMKPKQSFLTMCKQCVQCVVQKAANKALHRTAIPLRSIATGELCREIDCS